MSRKNKTAPFDTQKKSFTDEMPTARHVKSARFMTTRAAVFMGFSIFSMNLEFFIGNGLPQILLASLAGVLVWCLTFRFIRPVNEALTVLAFVMPPAIFWGLSLIPNFLTSPLTAPGFMPMALGLSVMGVIKQEGKDDFHRAYIWREVVFSFVFSALAFVFGCLVGSLFEKPRFFSFMLLSVAFLIIAAWLISKIINTPLYFTSKRLTEFWDIPVADFEETKRFIFARIKFAVTVFCTGVILYILTVRLPDFVGYTVYPAAVLVSALFGFAMLYTGRAGERKSFFGTKFFVFEALLGAAFVSSPFLLLDTDLENLGLYFFFAVSCDIFISALLAVIRRRQIFVAKSKYIDGMPFMLILISLFIMVLEAVFSII